MTMLGTFVITWREAIEAALIVGILMTYLQKIGESRQYRYVWAGVGLGIGASIGFGLISGGISRLFEGIGQELFQAAILGLAVIVLTYMVVWMHYNSRHIKGELQKKADEALATRKLWMLGSLAFIGVFREGIETVLFLWGLVLQGGGAGHSWIVTGGFLGILVAVFMAWVFFKGFGHLNLRTFFSVTGVLLIFIAAGMLSTATGKLISVGVLPGLIEPVWNSSWLVTERSFAGALLSGLLGYRSRPSLMEVIAYALYFVTVVGWLQWRNKSTAVS